MAQISLALPAGPAPAPVSLAPDPVSLIDPAEIAAWADEQVHDYLISFFAIVEAMPLDALIDAIRQACQRGFGVWMEPPRRDPAQVIRPATHLVEIALFGVTGAGLTLDEAATSWRRAARHVLEGEAAA